MEIVHISEPGKERNLTKSSSIISWLLSPASKVSQMALSHNQDHRAGLVLAAQDWMHQRRVSSESFESYFIYDHDTRFRLDNIWNTYQDWTESTDFIPRRKGGMALKAWFQYIGFPPWYESIVLRVSQFSYRVRETLIIRSDTGETERVPWKGVVSEGFMMGNPLTKTILHLMHDVHFGMVELLLNRMDVSVASWEEISNRAPIAAQGQLGNLTIRREDI